MIMTGKGLAAFAISKLGTPYVYGAKGADGKFTQARLNWLAKNYPGTFTRTYIAKAKKFIGKVCCDCSGLISWYTGKVYGSSQLYQKASKRIPISQIKTMPIGTVLWKQGHVGVYIGMENGIPMCVEEKGINYGCVKTKVSSTKWSYGLLFSYMEYTSDANATTKVEGTSKGSNPYKEPTVLITSKAQAKKKKVKTYVYSGEEVKWLQWELVEAGYELVIDGICGSKTVKALIAYQKSCKITADGLAGSTTRKYLKNNN